MFTLLLPLIACRREPPQPAAVPAPAPPPTMVFEGVPLTPELETVLAPVASASAMVNGAKVPLAYELIYRSGQDGFGDILALDGTTKITPACEEQDFNTLLAVGGRPWLVSHFECTPGGAYLTELAAAADGRLTPVKTRATSWDAWGGLWFPCSGMASPWGTSLGSEEYEPDARKWKPDGSLEPDPWKAFDEMVKIFPDKTMARPYRYGWATEIRVTPEGGAETAKHYAMGRFSHELSYVLPDRRTVVQSDDGSAVGLFLFVADRPADLSSGALYAAKFQQRDDGQLDIGWVPLGSATHAEVEAWIAADVRFEDLFLAATPTPEWTCEEGYRYVAHSYGGECLRLASPSAKVADPARAASRLETRRYAAYLGATHELEKGEGLAFDPATGTVYLALSAINARMLAEPGEPVDAVRLAENSCGGVFGSRTSAGVLDTEGSPIDSSLVPVDLAAALVGKPLAEPDAAGNRCDPESIANPDNLTFLPGYGLLTIAEDTRRHRNAALWVHDVATGQSTRVLVTPRGGEVTGIQWIPDLLGFGYLTVAVQHPWALAKDQPIPANVTDADKRSFTGYLGPFPSLTVR